VPRLGGVDSSSCICACMFRGCVAVRGCVAAKCGLLLAGRRKLNAMPQSCGKRAASPSSSESGKKLRLGLTAEEVSKLNQRIKYWLQDFPSYTSFTPAEVTTRVLAGTFQQVFVAVSDSSCAPTLDDSWRDAQNSEERIKCLSQEDQLNLASKWVEARNQENWEIFANNRTLYSSHQCICHTQLRPAILQLRRPQSTGRAYSNDQGSGMLVSDVANTSSPLAPQHTLSHY
jgi:hypothetical protein